MYVSRCKVYCSLFNIFIVCIDFFFKATFKTVKILLTVSIYENEEAKEVEKIKSYPLSVHVCPILVLYLA